MYVYSLTLEDLTQHGNTVLIAVFDQLQKDGLLTKEQVKQCDNYAVIAYKKGLFRSVWEKYLNISKPMTNDTLVYKVVKG